MEIIVQNQQRRHKLDLTSLEVMTNKLAQAVIDNLSRHKPKWIANLGSIKKSGLLSLIIVSGPTIRKLNGQWLNKDQETDVLSFPLCNLACLDKALKKDPQSQLGEIFISYEQAYKQAKQYNHSLERELAFLFVHGLLHIFGFDHQDKASEKEMFGRQKKILNKAGYLRH